MKKISINLLILFTSLLLITKNTYGLTNDKLNIYFDKKTYKESINSITAKKIKIYNNNIYFDIDLKIPGDYYEFTIETKNKSNYNATIEEDVNILLNKKTKLINAYITYYNGKKIKKGDILKANTKEKYIIHVEFKKDIINDDLKELPLELKFSIPIKYIEYI